MTLSNDTRVMKNAEKRIIVQAKDRETPFFHIYVKLIQK